MAQYQITKDDCFFGNYPTMVAVDTAYGNNASIQWVYAHLVNLSEYSGSRDKLNTNQCRELSYIIRSTYGYYKVTELMQFFLNFKSGRYGHFYGGVDPLAIMEALNKFNRERLSILGRKEEEERRKEQEEWRKNAIPFDKYMDAVMKNEKKFKYSEMALSIAKAIMNNDYNVPDVVLCQMREKFIKDYGITPEEYTKKEPKK